jgi:hypothetical protein
MEFRDFDPYCPEHYQCQEIDKEAEWFAGYGPADFRHSIDLEKGSMDR